MSAAPLEGYYLEDLAPGMSAEIEETITQDQIQAFAEVSGDRNPVHLDEDYASGTMFKTRIAHGMLSASFISAVLAMKLPGPGTIYLSQSVSFKAPVKPGDTVVTRVTVAAINAERRRVTLKCEGLVADKVVLDGEAEVMVPSRAA